MGRQPPPVLRRSSSLASVARRSAQSTTGGTTRSAQSAGGSTPAQRPAWVAAAERRLRGEPEPAPAPAPARRAVLKKAAATAAAAVTQRSLEAEYTRGRAETVGTVSCPTRRLSGRPEKAVVVFSERSGPYLGTATEWRSCPLVLILLCTSRGRRKQSNAARMGSDGARTAELVPRYEAVKRLVEAAAARAAGPGDDQNQRADAVAFSTLARRPPARQPTARRSPDSKFAKPSLRCPGASPLHAARKENRVLTFGYRAGGRPRSSRPSSGRRLASATRTSAASGGCGPRPARAPRSGTRWSSRGARSRGPHPGRCPRRGGRSNCLSFSIYTRPVVF